MTDSGLSCHQCGRKYSEHEAYQAMISGECPACGFRYDKPR